MDRKYPQLFQGGTTSQSSVLNPCAKFIHRSSRVRDLPHTFLEPVTPPPPFSTPPKPAELPACAAVSAKSFYRAFNCFSRDLYLFRKENTIRVKAALLLFDLTGSLIDEEFLKKIQRKGPLFSEMPSSCKDIRAALAQCLQESDCVMIQRNKPSDCLRAPLIDTMPTKCQQLKKGYGECKRGMVDMRKRFRGNQPIAVSKEIEGGAQEPSHQLYAGKPAFGVVKDTSGHEPVERDWREVENEKFREGK